MNNRAGTILIDASAPVVCLKLVGWANATLSLDFKSAVYPLRAQGRAQFRLDATECINMDSTFLGVLTAFARKLAPAEGQAAALELINLNKRVRALLENLEALSLFKLAECPGGLQGDFQPVQPVEITKAGLGQAVLEAHESLMDLSSANIPKFKEVVETVRHELEEGKS
jgi:anti-anti-sigma regulatory factor